MKTLSALLLTAFFLPASLLANPPSLLAAQAAAIAQKDLDDRAMQTEVFVADMRYKKASFGDKEHWEVLWSKTFPAQTEGRNEIGLKVFMDGTYTRSVR